MTLYVTSPNFNVLIIIINFLLATNDRENILQRTIHCLNLLMPYMWCMSSDHMIVQLLWYWWDVNVNVNVEVYSLKSPWVQQTLQFTPLVLELSLVQSHLLWGEFSAFSAADAIHNFSNFRSTRYPSLLCGQRWHGMRGFAQHLYTLINFQWS